MDGDEAFGLDSPHFKLMDFIVPQGDDPTIIKATRNCFTSTNLQARLLHLGVRRLTITGVQMEQCCATTTRIAADLGYAVDFVVDAILTFPIPNPDVSGEELDVAAIKERTVFGLRRRFARIVHTQELCTELQELPLAVLPK